MSDSKREKILAAVAAEDFISRIAESDALANRAESKAAPRGLLLLSAPALGASELLRQTYDRLFGAETNEVIPFYFAVQRTDKTARQAALRFLQTFLQQTIAFRRRSAKILAAAPGFDEIAELALPGDGHWIDRLITAAQTENNLTGEREFVRSCLSAPLRAASEGARVFVMIDNLHQIESFSGEMDFFNELKEIYSRSKISFVFAGHRRFLFNAAKVSGAKLENVETMELKPLDFSEAGLLAESLALKSNVKINEQTRDLIAVQTAGNPSFIKNILQAAQTRKIDLDSFQRVEQIYTDEIFGGGTAKFYDAFFDEVAPNVETQKHILGLYTML